jgi:protocatechuate 3,4-dioxygenase alpha subunit
MPATTQAKLKSHVSPFCTTGPYFPVEWADAGSDLTRIGSAIAQGQHLIIAGSLVEAGGKPTRNSIIELWQPDSTGIFRHPLDPRTAQADPGFTSWGRARTLADGTFRLRTVMPGAYEENGVMRLPHINVMVLAIGLTRRLVTTLFFQDAPDPVLDLVPQTRRHKLIAQRDPSLDTDGAQGYRFDILLQGEGETPFFAD